MLDFLISHSLDQWLEISKIAGIMVGAIAALSGMTLGWYNRKKLTTIYLTLNSRLDHLLRAAHAEGRIAERSDIIAGITAPPSPVQTSLELSDAKTVVEAVLNRSTDPK